MARLQGKIAVITGGNSGIGLATAKSFIDEGAQVVIAGRDQKTLDAAVKELGSKCLALQVDVAKLAELDTFYKTVGEKFGRIDILFVNAGIANFIPIEQMTDKDFDTMFNVNTKGLFFTVQKAIPLLSQGSSVILTTSSIVEKGVSGASVYAASKAAVRSMARSFSVELLARGIRVNALSPGPVETPIFGRMGLPAEQTKAMTEMMAARVPLKRMGRSEELAKAAVFLASDESSFMLGSQVSVDGGVSQL